MLEDNPRSVDATIGVGTVQHRREQYREARETFQKSRRPRRPPARRPLLPRPHAAAARRGRRSHCPVPPRPRARPRRLPGPPRPGHRLPPGRPARPRPQPRRGRRPPRRRIATGVGQPRRDILDARPIPRRVAGLPHRDRARPARRPGPPGPRRHAPEARQPLPRHQQPHRAGPPIPRGRRPRAAGVRPVQGPAVRPVARSLPPIAGLRPAAGPGAQRPGRLPHDRLHPAAQPPRLRRPPRGPRRLAAQPPDQARATPRRRPAGPVRSAGLEKPLAVLPLPTCG